LLFPVATPPPPNMRLGHGRWVYKLSACPQHFTVKETVAAATLHPIANRSVKGTVLRKLWPDHIFLHKKQLLIVGVISL